MPCQDELPCAFEAVLDSNLFVTLPGPLGHGAIVARLYALHNPRCVPNNTSAPHRASLVPLLGHLPSSLLHSAPGRESAGRPPSQHARSSSKGGRRWILPSPSNFCVRTTMRSSRRGGAMGACKCRR